MYCKTTFLRSFRCACVAMLLGCVLLTVHADQMPTRSAAVLVYHRFGQQISDSTTTRTAVFRKQIEALRSSGYHIIPLNELISGLYGTSPLPYKALAITVDDGHSSFYEDVLPIVRRERIPITLFIYPSAISNASYAMTWAQLQEAMATGLVQIESHTYWHPNFLLESKRMEKHAYRRFVQDQFVHAREVLKRKLGTEATLLAWPFGIFDRELEFMAEQAGYRAAFALGNRNSNSNDNVFALPRYMVVDHVGVTGLLHLLRAGETSTDKTGL